MTANTHTGLLPVAGCADAPQSREDACAGRHEAARDPGAIGQDHGHDAQSSRNTQFTLFTVQVPTAYVSREPCPLRVP